MPSFQSPVPISGRPCAPTARLWSRARAQCSKSVALLSEIVGWKNASRSPVAKHRAFEKWNHLIENRRIAGDLRRNARRHRRSQTRSSEMRVRTPSPGCRQPPMLHVAFDELPRGGAQQMRARQSGPRHAERHHVLQLIAEAVGAAGLVEAGARPQAARQRLVEQPAVQHDVHRAVRRPHLHGAEQSRPSAASTAPQHGIEIGRAILREQSCALPPLSPPGRERRRSPLRRRRSA